MPSELKKYLYNTLYLFGGKIINIISELFIGVLVARYLEPKGFGTYSYILSIFYIFLVFSKFGLDSIIVKFLISDKEKESVILGTAFLIRLSFSFFLVFFCGILWFLGVEYFEIILVMVISLVPSSFNILKSYFQTNVISKYQVFAEGIAKIFSSIIKIIVLIYELNLSILLLSVFIEIVIIPIIIFYFYRRFFYKEWNFSYDWAKKLIAQSWPMLLTGGAVILHMRMDQVMIKNMLDEESLGYYAAAIKLCESWYFIPGILTSSFFPKFLEFRYTNLELFEEKITQMYSILIYISIIVALFVTLFSKVIIGNLYGEEFLPAGAIMNIYIWSGVWVSVGYLGDKWYHSFDLEKYKFLFTFLGLIINLILNYFFISLLGYVGAAYATFGSLIIYVFIINLFFKKTSNNFYSIVKGFNPINSLSFFLSLKDKINQN